MNPQFWWYVARASGIIAWLLLTASVIWGILLSTDAFPTHRRPAWLLDLHRWLGGLTVAFVGDPPRRARRRQLHPLRPRRPGHPVRLATGDPGAVALGVVATWLLVAVELTSLAMRRLPRNGSGEPSTSPATSCSGSPASTPPSPAPTAANSLYQLTAAASIAAIVWALVYRLTNRRPVRRRPASVDIPPATATRHQT